MINERPNFNENSFLPLRETVFHTLRDAILKGELRPGERLMEVHLAQQLGVSRTPVREAIRKLEKEGLAVINPRRGAEVAKMTEKDLDDVLQVRTALESLAFTMASDHIDEKGLADLKEAMLEFEKAVQGDDVKLMVEKDEDFHNVIYTATGNPKLLVLITNIREQMYRYRFEYLMDRNSYPRLVEEHREIYECLEKHDTIRGENAIQLHISGQRKGVKIRINQQ